LINAYQAAKYLDDNKAPEKINDLSVISAKTNFVTIKWTTPIDFSYLNVYSYDLRISNQPINENNFFIADKIEIHKQKKIGTVDTFTINTLEPNKTYYIAMESSDMWNNISEISNIVSFTTNGYPQYQILNKNIFKEISFNQLNNLVDTIIISNISPNTSFLEGNISLTNVNVDPTNPVYENFSSNDYVFFNSSNNSKVNFPTLYFPISYSPNWILINPNYNVYEEGFAKLKFNGKKFKFFNKYYDRLFLSTNGFISFDTITSIANRQNTNIPNTNQPNNLIAFFWDNMKLISKSQTYVYENDDYLMIEGIDWSLSNDTSGNNNLSFQVLLNFVQNSITVKYNKIPINLSSITIWY
jgi:hypothetical protein